MANEFYRRGTTKIYFLDTEPASLTEVKRSELLGGVDLSSQINAIEGFMFKNSLITVENLETTFDATIGGPDQADASALTMNEQRNASGVTGSGFDTVRAALPKGTSGYIVIAPYGQSASNQVEVWPVVVTSNSRQFTLAAETAKYRVEFGVTEPPTQNSRVMPGATAGALAVTATLGEPAGAEV
jgi:hypothetical protein